MTAKKLKIGLDMRGIEPGFKAHAERGTGTYIRELTHRLHTYTECPFDFIDLQSADIGLTGLQQNILKNLPRGKVTFESQICLRKNIKQSGCDIAHFFSHGDAPSFPLIPQIVTILDLIPLRFPELYESGPMNLRFKLARYLENKAAISSKGVIAISHATKKDIIEILGIPADKIFVTHLGVHDSFFSPGTLLHLSQLLEKYQLRDETKNTHYGLYVGGLDARKNIPFLLEICKEMRKEKNTSNLQKKNFKILIAGNYKNEKTYPALQKLILELDLKDQIIFLGYVPHEDLLSFYQSSDIFIFPSLYEGFGLPVLEAMASGTPVLAGNNSCMTEVLGNNTFLVEDNNLDSWVRSLHTILRAIEEKEVALLDQLNQNTLRAKRFTWQQTAQSTIDAYRQITKMP